MGILIKSNNSGIISSGGGGGGYQTPDIANNLDFETGYSGFWAWSSAGTNPTSINRDNTKAYHGSWSIQYVITANGSDAGGRMEYNLRNPGGDGSVNAGYSRIWVRFYFNVTAKITTHWKYWRFYDSDSFNAALGGLWIKGGQGGFSWCFDDSLSIEYPLGGSDSIFDGTWHYVEFDYQQNGTAPDGSTWQNAAVWVDGIQLTQSDGSAGLGGPAYWKSGRIYAGSRVNSQNLGCCECMGTLNGGNTATGYSNWDYVSISSLGRIGP